MLARTSVECAAMCWREKIMVSFNMYEVCIVYTVGSTFYRYLKGTARITYKWKTKKNTSKSLLDVLQFFPAQLWPFIPFQWTLFSVPFHTNGYIFNSLWWCQERWSALIHLLRWPWPDNLTWQAQWRSIREYRVYFFWYYLLSFIYLIFTSSFSRHLFWIELVDWHHNVGEWLKSARNTLRSIGKYLLNSEQRQ